MRELLEEAGMEFAAMYDAYTKEPVRKDSERVCIIARERGKRPQRNFCGNYIEKKKVGQVNE